MNEMIGTPDVPLPDEERMAESPTDPGKPQEYNRFWPWDFILAVALLFAPIVYMAIWVARY